MPLSSTPTLGVHGPGREHGNQGSSGGGGGDRTSHPRREGNDAAGRKGGRHRREAQVPASGAARRPARRCDSGAVTAEFAVALPAIVLVLVGGLTGISAGITQLRLEEAARAAAREVMRGDRPAAAAAVERLAGDSAQLALSEEGDWTSVEVRTSLSIPVLSLLPLELSAQATAFPGDGGYPVGIPGTR